MSENFGENLRLARELAGLSQKQAAERAGMSRSAYSLYELGTREPDVKGIKALAKALNVTGDYLLGLEPLQNEAEIIGMVKRYGGKRLMAYADALSRLEQAEKGPAI